ncbi:MAG: rRNA pseudouridine synthase [Syntrophales bacterium]|jgi:23S rRNA pseudouridine2605 synthase|nr:rRNA pseudouridine synthase [Syntrophales bacterium]MDY0044992.1 pseudouridine synthase [Syntrophales bacterium]
MQERLQKIIAKAGIVSRRKAEELIRNGKVSVNGATVIELGRKADAQRDEIRVEGALISTGTRKIYLMLNKPEGVLTSMKDPFGRRVVSELVNDLSERVYPVGRLDYNSRGLLLMTNDGDFSYRISHPGFGIPKTYVVKMKGKIDAAFLNNIKSGASLSDGFFKPLCVAVEAVNPKSTWLKLIIVEGKNRIIRRFFAAFDITVLRLVRTAIADVEIGNLKPGDYRHLTKQEVSKLLSFNQGS